MWWQETSARPHLSVKFSVFGLNPPVITPMYGWWKLPLGFGEAKTVVPIVCQKHVVQKLERPGSQSSPHNSSCFLGCWILLVLFFFVVFDWHTFFRITTTGRICRSCCCCSGRPVASPRGVSGLVGCGSVWIRARHDLYLKCSSFFWDKKTLQGQDLSIFCLYLRKPCLSQNWSVSSVCVWSVAVSSGRNRGGYSGPGNGYNATSR